MSINWDLYNRRLSINGTTQRERDLNNYKTEFLNEFESSLSCKSIEINGVTTKIMVIETNYGNIKQIISPSSSQFNSGDYVTLSNSTYMVTDIDLDDEIQVKGKMQLCNYVLKFQHPLTKEILSYHCIDDSSNLSGGVEISEILSDGNATKTLKLPYDMNTVLINTDQRFIVDDSMVEIPQVFKVTKPNRTSLRRGVKGLVELTLKQDKFDVNTDDKDMGICNYKSPSVEPINRGYSEIVTTDEEFIIYVGSYTELIANFYDNDGRKIEDIIPDWDVSSTTISSNDYIVSVNNNILKIQTKQSYSNIGKYIDVKLKNNNYESNIQLKIVM